MSDNYSLNQDQLFQMLNYVLSGNNEHIKEATKVLKVYTKSTHSVGPLAQILSQNENQQYRQLSAILLKRNMATKYSNLDEQSKQDLKLLLVERFFKEQVNVIRTNIGQLIGIVAVQTLPNNQWPELYQILQNQTAKGQDIVTRQRGLMLLSLIFDYSGDSLKPFYSVFFNFFVENLQDEDKIIRQQTVKCLISLFDNIEHMEKQEAQQYKTLVEPILRFVDQCIKEGDEDTAYHCFDAFSYLADAQLTILDTHLGMIIEYAASQNLLLNNKCSNKFKECVIDFIYSVIESHKKIFNSKNSNLLKQLIECLSLVIAQPLTQNDMEDDSEPIQDVALWLIETMSIQIAKKKQIYSIFLGVINSLIESNDGNRMNSGYLILGSVTEGLQDQIRRNLQNPIMNVLIPKGLNDERVEVRGAAIKCLSYFSEFLCPEILNYDNVVIPEMVKSLSNQQNKIYEKALLTIDIFAENMEEEKITPYIQTLVPHLIQLFLNQSTTFVARRYCLSSISSIIASSKNQFIPYLKGVSDLLLKVLEEKDTPEILSIKAEALQVLGTIAESFKENQEVQQQLINPLAPSIFKMLTENSDYEIREGCLSFFYNMASAQGEAFGPIFTQIIDFTLQLAKSNEGISYDQQKKEFSLDTESDSDEDDDNKGPMRVKVSQMDEKAAAIHALGQFAMSVPLLFGNYFKPTFELLDNTISFFYDNIRVQTLQCYRDLIEAYVRFRNGGKLPDFTPGLPCIETFEPEFANLLQLDIMQKLLSLIAEDESVECAALAIDTITDLTKKLGPQFLHKNLQEITKTITLILSKKIRCLGTDLEAEEDGDDDMNQLVFENLTDLIPAMAKVLKQGFILTFRAIAPYFYQDLNKDKDIDSIIQVIGCFAQLFEYEPSIIQESQNTVIPFLLNILQIGDVELNRNAAYALATYSEFAKEEDVLKILPNILLLLKQIFDTSDSYKEGKENAMAAVCRIMIRFPQSLPLKETLDSIIPLLPFQADPEENFTAIKMLLHLGNTQPDLIADKMEIVIKLLLDCAAKKEHYKLKDNQLNQIVTSLKALLNNAQYKQNIEQQIMNMNDQVLQQKLVKLLQ